MLSVTGGEKRTGQQMHLTSFESTKVIGKEVPVTYKPGWGFFCDNFVTCVVSHVVSVLRHNYKDFLLFVLIHHGHKVAQLLMLIFCYTSYQHEKG